MKDSLKIIVKTHTSTRTQLHEALGKAGFRVVLDEALTAALNEALDLQRGERLRVPAEFKCYYFRIDPAIAAPDPLPDLLAALEALVKDERKFISGYQETVDSYLFICNFCGASHNGEYQIEHKSDCEIVQARAAMAGARGAE